MRTGNHLGVAKVTDLQPGRWPAIKQCVLQLKISMTHALQESMNRVPAVDCLAVLGADWGKPEIGLAVGDLR